MLNLKKGTSFLLLGLIIVLASCQTDLPPESTGSTNQADPAAPAPAAAVAVKAEAVVESAAEETAAQAPAPAEGESQSEAANSDSPREVDGEMAQLIAEYVRQEGTPNLLVDEKSPYLLQHAYNPVDWHPWSDETFAKAAAEDKPVFLSIGYSTCHWCHVMRDESFEDNEVAALMNQSFISIKVDREERPDIDNIYMNVAQITGNRGGWPLTIIMTPDQKPFFTATYIPKGSRFERTGMLDLIPQVDAAWVGQRDEIIAYSETVVEALQSQQTQVNQGVLASGPVNVLDSRTLDSAFIALDQSFDPIFGGFGEAPKFPSPHNLLFLLRYGQRTGDEKALAMVETTLQGMRLGGVYDQIGFGFHRYSTDQRWQLPHFEKMLYDQAMLSIAYTETAQASEDEFYEEVAREIFTYVLRDMTDPQGAFYSAEDADSEGEEGIFYFWTITEIQELLSPEDAEMFIQLSSMSAEGNFLDEATGQKIGENIIFWNQPPTSSAAQFDLSVEEFDLRLENIRQTLFTAREERIHPHKDDKILTDWNGLMIASLAKAGQAFNEPEYITAATKAADFLLETMQNEDGRLLHRYRAGEADILANADDYANLTWGLLELYEATFDLKYLEAALTLNEDFNTHFWDEETGGYWFTPDDGEELLVRQKQIYDGAIPSGNSVAMLNLLRLGRITANADYEEQAFELTESFYGQVSAAPTAFTHLLSGLEFGIGPSYEVIIIGEEGTADTEAMLAALRDEYVPNKVVLLRGLDEDGPLTELADYTNFYYAIDGQATAYVCQNYVCEFPTNDPVKMVELLFQSTEVGTDE